MPDIFISYSRRDGDFGKKLHQTFVGLQKDIWMDWEDIPLTADWWTEIRRGIETSDNFVLIMSPDSIGSPVCQLEIEYARRMNKRIVPIFHRDPQFEESTRSVVERTKTDEHLRRMMDGRDAAQLMEDNKKVLATLNWVFFKDEDDFEEKFRQLSQIVDADLTHIRQHTRWQVKALEWVESSKNISFVLLGDELTAAETWLAAGVDKLPAPTELHREFIAVSRKTETSRRRLMRGLQITSLVAGLLIIVATGAALFSVNSANTANERADYAATQVADAATAQQDANVRADYAITQAANAEIQATAAFEAQQTAVLQANAAATAQQKSDNAAAELAAQVEVFGATLTPISPTLTAVAEQVITGESHAAAMRLSGEAIAQNQNDLADPRTTALLAIRSLRHEYSGLADNTLLGALDKFYQVRTFGEDPAITINNAAFLPDGSLLTAGDGIHLWNTATGALEKTLLETGQTFSIIALSPDGSRLMAFNESDTAAEQPVYLWALENDSLRELPVRLPEDTGSIFTPVFAPDGTPYVVLFPGDCRLWNLTEGTALRYPLPCYDAVFSQDRQWIATLNDQTVTLHPLESGEDLEIERARQPDLFSPAAFSPDSRLLAVAHQNRVELWNVLAGRQTLTLSGHSDVVTGVQFSGDSRSLTTASRDGTIRLWNVADGQVQRTLPAGGQFMTTAISADGQWLVSAIPGTSQPAILWTLSGGIERHFKAGNAPVGTLAFTPDSLYLVGAGDDGFAVYEVAADDITLRQSVEIAAEPGTRPQTAMQPGGTLLARMTTGTLTFTDVLTGDEQSSAAYTEEDYGWLAFTPDGSRLVTISSRSDGWITVWDVASWQVLSRWRKPADSMNAAPDSSITISTDGNTLLFSGDDAVLALDLTTGMAQPALETLSADTPIVYSPDGNWIAGAFTDDTGSPQVRLVDARTGTVAKTFAAQSEPAAYAFSPDSRLLVFSEDRTVQVLNIAGGQILRVLNSENVSALAFSLDGIWLAAGTKTGDVRLWNVGYDATIAYACERLAGYDFTAEDRARYALDESPTCP